jgi:hypothetical protein
MKTIDDVLLCAGLSCVFLYAVDMVRGVMFWISHLFS